LRHGRFTRRAFARLGAPDGWKIEGVKGRTVSPVIADVGNPVRVSKDSRTTYSFMMSKNDNLSFCSFSSSSGPLRAGMGLS
jgi:hypothetical protein